MWLVNCLDALIFYISLLILSDHHSTPKRGEWVPALLLMMVLPPIEMHYLMTGSLITSIVLSGWLYYHTKKQLVFLYGILIYNFQIFVGGILGFLLGLTISKNLAIDIFLNKYFVLTIVFSCILNIVFFLLAASAFK